MAEKRKHESISKDKGASGSKQSRSDIVCKGYKARKKTMFPKGRMTRFYGPQPEPKDEEPEDCEPLPIKRYKKSFLSDVAFKSPSNDLSTPGANGVDGNAMILRPIPDDEDKDILVGPCNDRASGTGEHNMDTGYMLLEKSRLLGGINSFITAHQEYNKCDKLDIDMVELQPWGLYTSAKFSCKTCQFKTSKHERLYEEVDTQKPGRKAAAGNLRLALLNQDIAIGPTEVQLLFAAAGLHVNVTNMQKTAVKVSEITESLARRDMEKWLNHANEVYKARGVESTNQISAEFDVLYHAMNKSNSHCPGQAASSATALCVETVTPQKKVIDFEHFNRVCIKGSNLRGNNIAAVCGHKTSKAHHACTATIPPGQIIREYDMAHRIARRLKAKGKSVTHLVTDSDAKGRDAFIDVNKADPSLPQTTWYKDPSHTSRNMRKKVSICSLAGKIFGYRKDGCEWNTKEKYECRKALALDVPKRVSLTLSNMRMYYRGSLKLMAENVETIAEYMLKCYGGDHTSCKSSRLAKLTGCGGRRSSGRCWFTRSHVLKAQGLCALKLSKKNKAFLQSVIAMKLSKENLGFYARGETSSKCEATNRGINKGYSKNRNYWRTGAGRVASAVLRINNGFLESTTMKFREMKVPLPANSQGAIVIRKYQRKRIMTRRAQQSASYQDRRHKLIAQKAARYFQEKTKDTNESDYLKFQLDEAIEASAQAIMGISISDDESALERDVNRASSLSDHLQMTLEHTYSKTRSAMAKQREVTKKRKVAQENRVIRQQEKRCARKTSLRAGQAKSVRDRNFYYYPHCK